MTDRRRGLVLWLLFLALGAIWGSSFLFIKIGLLEGLRPFTLVTVRLLIASTFLIAAALVLGFRLPRDRITLVRLPVVAFVNVAVPFACITWAELSIPSALASILNGLVPLFTIFIAAVLIHDEPITVNRLTGLVIGFVGAAILLSRDLETSVVTGSVSASQLPGQLAMVVASLSYAVAAVLIRRWFREPVVDDPRLGRRRKMTPVELGLVQSVLGGVMIGVLALLLERGPGGLPVLPATPEGWLAVSWLGLLGSGVAYLLFFHLIAAWGATRTTLVTYIMPPVGILLGVVVLRESMDLRVIVGTALIIGGIALVNSRFGQRRLYGRATAVPAQER